MHDDELQAPLADGSLQDAAPAQAPQADQAIAPTAQDYRLPAMKHIIEEFRVGTWAPLGQGVAGSPFETWAEAATFIDRLRRFYPFRQYRIVPIGEQPPGSAA